MAQSAAAADVPVGHPGGSGASNQSNAVNKLATDNAKLKAHLERLVPKYRQLQRENAKLKVAMADAGAKGIALPPPAAREQDDTGDAQKEGHRGTSGGGRGSAPLLALSLALCFLLGALGVPAGDARAQVLRP